MKIAGRSFVDPQKFGTMLFDVEQDPQQQVSLVDEAQERRMLVLLADQMRANDAPPEQYERLGIPASGAVADENLLLVVQRPLVDQATGTHISPVQTTE